MPPANVFGPSGAGIGLVVRLLLSEECCPRPGRQSLFESRRHRRRLTHDSYPVGYARGPVRVASSISHLPQMHDIGRYQPRIVGAKECNHLRHLLRRSDMQKTGVPLDMLAYGVGYPTGVRDRRINYVWGNAERSKLEGCDIV